MSKSSNSLLIKWQSLKKGLIRSVSHIVPPDEVEDIVQETYVKIWLMQKKQKKQITTNNSFFYTVARNLALDFLKRAENKFTDIAENESDFQTDETDPCLQSALSAEKFQVFCEAVRILPTQCRRAFVLKKVYGFKIKEIAIEMDLSVRTVEKHLQVAYEKLDAYMSEQEEKNMDYLFSVKEKTHTGERNGK